MRGSRHSVVWVDSKSPTAHVNPSFSGTRSPPRPLLRRRSTIKLLYGPGIASPPWLSSQSVKILCTWVASAIYSLTLNLPELVPVHYGHPRPQAPGSAGQSPARSGFVGRASSRSTIAAVGAPAAVRGHVWVARGGGRAVSAPPGRASGSMAPLPDPSESLSGHVRSMA